MNVDYLLLECETNLHSVKLCCNQCYDISRGIKICGNCNNLIFDHNISPYPYHYTVLYNFLQHYYIPEYLELNKLGLIFWTEYLILDLLNQTNMYEKEFTISDFIYIPRKYILKLIYVYLIKNNIIDNTYL